MIGPGSAKIIQSLQNQAEITGYDLILDQAADGPSSEVQFGQRLALIAMVEKQKGHSLVVGSAGGASSWRLRLFMPLISMNTAKATIVKLITALKNTP